MNASVLLEKIVPCSKPPCIGVLTFPHFFCQTIRRGQDRRTHEEEGFGWYPRAGGDWVVGCRVEGPGKRLYRKL